MECSNISVVGDLRCMRSIVCVHSRSISVSDAYKSVKSELIDSLLSPFVPLWESHCVGSPGVQEKDILQPAHIQSISSRELRTRISNWQFCLSLSVKLHCWSSSAINPSTVFHIESETGKNGSVGKYNVNEKDISDRHVIQRLQVMQQWMKHAAAGFLP